MDQQDLRAFEYRCIQEEWPKCQAACPIHVDVRGLMTKMAAGDPVGARKVLERTMPLPGVLGRICDHPCEPRCIREAVDAPLSIGAMERACLEAAGPGGKPLCMPAKGKRVAVLGGDVGGLTVAWDLAKKGYAVTVFAAGEAVGGHLLGLPETLLPPAVLAAELNLLARMGVIFKIGMLFSAELLETVKTDFDAVYVEMADPRIPGPARAAVGALTLASGDGVFYGGWPRNGDVSVIAMAADGRKAAVSMDRFLAGVSQTAGRDKEGVCATRLFTSLVDVPHAKRVEPADAVAGYAPAEARAEAARCLNCQCLECVKVCSYLEHYKAYPRGYARQIYNNLSIVQGARSHNRMINSCMLCLLCTEVCPEDFSMADLCLSARRDMVARGKMPPSAHEFALEDMAFSNGPDFALVRNAPGTDKSAHLFYPGCQLGGDPAGKVAEAYDFLRGTLHGGVGIALGCCGAPALWAGRDDLFTAAMADFRAAWEGMGRPRVIAACSSCLAAFAKAVPDIPTISLWRVLTEETGLPESRGFHLDCAVAVHDPCSSRHDEASQAAVRGILSRLSVPVEELTLSGRFTECCGYGGLQANAHPELAETVIKRRAERSHLDFVATCAMCRDRLAGAGKRAYHLLDLLFPGEPGNDPASRGNPGFSLRHESRARLRRKLLDAVWGQPEPATPLPGLPLVIPEAVRALMEERHILDADLAQVVAHAEATGRKFLDRSTGRFLASFTPTRVTYWVEYAVADGRAYIHAAYSHRMAVDGAGK